MEIFPLTNYPELPYNTKDGPSSGHSGGGTSRERAEREDDDGTTAKRQQRVISTLIGAESRGRTCAEVQGMLGIGHGSASGALTVLHKARRIRRLAERRNRQFVYVMPDQVRGREETFYRPNSARVDLINLQDGVEIALFYLDDGNPAAAADILRSLQ